MGWKIGEDIVKLYCIGHRYSCSSISLIFFSFIFINHRSTRERIFRIFEFCEYDSLSRSTSDTYISKWNSYGLTILRNQDHRTFFLLNFSESKCTDNLSSFFCRSTDLYPTSSSSLFTIVFECRNFSHSIFSDRKYVFIFFPRDTSFDQRIAIRDLHTSYSGCRSSHHTHIIF